MKIVVTDNEEIKQSVRQGLKANNNYCPCRLEKTPDTKCQCKEFREQESGPCYCGLFIKIDNNS